MLAVEKKSHYFISELVAVDGGLFIDTEICSENIKRVLGHDEWILPYALGKFENFRASVAAQLTIEEADILEANGAFRVCEAAKPLALSLGNKGWELGL